MFGRKEKQQGVRAAAAADGAQAATVLVKDGFYRPETIVAERGKPVRLTFVREEASPCSEVVVFEQLGSRAALPEEEPVTVELTPEQPGSYAFTCGMGMYRGTLVIE